jgi:hypothetical protein
MALNLALCADVSLVARAQQDPIWGSAPTQEHASSLIRAKEAIQPDFRGFDVMQRFPEWKGRNVLLSKIFEGADGGLVARVNVAGRKAYENVKSWEIDIVNGTKAAALKNLDGDPPGRSVHEIIGTREIKLSATTRLVSGQRNSTGHVDNCDDPIKDIYEIQNADPSRFGGWATVRSTMVITKEENASGYDIGGYCHSDGEKTHPKTFYKYAAAWGTFDGQFFVLGDGTILVQAGREPRTFIIRLESDLRMLFKAKGLIAMNVEDYEKIVTAKGIFGAQEQLLSMLN